MKLIKSRRLYIGALIVGTSVLSSCKSDPKEVVDQGAKGQLVFTMASADGVEAPPSYLMANAQGYVFGGDDAKFSQKLTGLAVSGKQISAKVPVGDWNVILLSRSNDGQGAVKTPVTGAAMSESVMWQSEIQEDGHMLQMPELFYASTGKQTIQSDGTTEASATLVRNVAKVILKVTNSYDMVVGEDVDNKIVLKNVPTTLSWSGKLMPDKDVPTVGTMKGNFVFDPPQQGTSLQHSKEIEFIMPAHRAADGQLGDTTTVFLLMDVDLSMANGDRYVRTDVPIWYTPKMNCILKVSLKLSKEVKVGISVEEWTVKEIGPDPY